MTDWPFGGLKPGHYGAIYADPPWSYVTWSAKGTGRSAEQHYATMDEEEISNLPVSDLAADNCVLFLWVTWPMLPQALRTIAAWGFDYKTGEPAHLIGPKLMLVRWKCFAMILMAKLAKATGQEATLSHAC